MKIKEWFLAWEKRDYEDGFEMNMFLEQTSNPSRPMLLRYRLMIIGSLIFGILLGVITI